MIEWPHALRQLFLGAQWITFISMHPVICTFHIHILHATFWGWIFFKYFPHFSDYPIRRALQTSREIIIMHHVSDTWHTATWYPCRLTGRHPCNPCNPYIQTFINLDFRCSLSTFLYWTSSQWLGNKSSLFVSSRLWANRLDRFLSFQFDRMKRMNFLTHNVPPG